MTPMFVIMAALTLAGSCIGSYAATAGLRSARGRQSTLGRSACDGCGVRLGFASTVPVLSFVRGRGQCSACGAPIDPAHLAGELAGAVILPLAFVAARPERGVALAVLGFALLTASIIDARTRRLPDLLTLAIAATGLCLGLMDGHVGVGLASAGAAFVLLEILRRGYIALRGAPGLGFGDVKLVAALALWLGVETPWALALASAAALVTALIRPSEDGRIPFGPFIAASGWAVGVFLEFVR